MPAPILIVEDDTDINNMMAEALTKAGYACTQAFSGTEGLLYLDQGPYALVILDLMLPGLEGEALLPQIKAKTGTPVLVVSAKDSLDSKVGLLTAGAVCISGTIGWIGLVIPHLSRMLIGPDHTKMLPVTVLLGGLFLLVIDTIARAATTVEIPLSILTGLVGAPFFAWLLFRQRARIS